MEYDSTVYLMAIEAGKHGGWMIPSSELLAGFPLLALCRKVDQEKVSYHTKCQNNTIGLAAAETSGDFIAKSPTQLEKYKKSNNEKQS